MKIRATIWDANTNISYYPIYIMAGTVFPGSAICFTDSPLAYLNYSVIMKWRIEELHRHGA